MNDVGKTKKRFPSCVHVLEKTYNVIVSRCCFAEDGKEIRKLTTCETKIRRDKISNEVILEEWLKWKLLHILEDNALNGSGTYCEYLRINQRLERTICVPPVTKHVVDPRSHAACNFRREGFLRDTL